MSIFSKRNIKVAANKRNKFNLSSKVITTLNIGDTQPIYCREVVPSDKWSLDIKSFTRLSPIPVPTYAQIKQVNRAFYVKYKDIWRNWEGFYTNTGALVNGAKVSVDSAPYVPNNSFVQSLLTTQVKIANYRGDSIAQIPLFDPQDSNGQYLFKAEYYNINFIGKKILNILTGLGIKLNFADGDTTPINILPILAYLKVHLDYYLPSRYFANSNIRNILTWQNVDYSAKFPEIIQELANCAYYYIDNDYFTSSWSTPNNIGTNPLVGTTTLSDPSVKGSFDIRDFNTNYASPMVVQSNSSSQGTLSAQGLQLLQSLYNWITRKNLSGNKYFEQILSQFGIHLPYHDDMRSLYLGGSVNMTEFGVVFDTGNQVGDYAGQGTNSSRTGNIDFSADEYGCVIVLTSIVPEMGYVQGRNREWLHINRLDFFQPEFDCVGMQGVRKDELLTVNNELDYKDVTVGADTYSNKAQTIIGYQPRYNEYRRNIDLLNGDFYHGNVPTSLSAYHSFRILPKDIPQASTLNQYFRRSDSFSPSINRIFNNSSINFDHFIAVFDVKAIAYRKMKSHDDAFDLDGYDDVTVNNDNSLD